MFVFETTVTSEREAQRLSTAFYRFLEMQHVSRRPSASLTTHMSAKEERKRIELWSDEAVRSFGTFYAQFTVSPPSNILRRSGRFDDLF